MSKTLSNGTLSLRFMQNAQRAKQEAQIKLEQAKIKDEAEWEVSQEIKDAWGISSSSADTNTQSATTHEASYIPFIFSNAGTTNLDESDAQPRGRRTFNSKGKEVKKELNEPKPTKETQDTATKRLTSISGFKAPLPTKQQSSGKAKTRTAQELIREGVGAQPSPHLVQNAESQPTPAGFVRPAGVDAPSLSRPKIDSTTSLKRERDLAAGEASTNKKRRKKKEVTLIE